MFSFLLFLSFLLWWLWFLLLVLSGRRGLVVVVVVMGTCIRVIHGCKLARDIEFCVLCQVVYLDGVDLDLLSLSRKVNWILLDQSFLRLEFFQTEVPLPVFFVCEAVL